MAKTPHSVAAPLRIGTRDSRLALWQAERVKRGLEEAGHACELVPVKSEGDLDTVTPLYEMGVQGVFTRSLDAALLAGRVDLAVHSMKDVPTGLAQGISIAAVLERGNPMDLLLTRDGASFMDDPERAAVIGSGSVRRRAQWSRRFPPHELRNLRGNVDTRLRKLREEGLDGIIIAAAGLERTGQRPPDAIVLDWMLPAPAQGAILVVRREDDALAAEATAHLGHAETALCAGIERDFLRHLHGGCSSPIGALAIVRDGTLNFRGNVLSVDGTCEMTIERKEPIGPENASMGIRAAEELLQQGAGELIVKGEHRP